MLLKKVEVGKKLKQVQRKLFIHRSFVESLKEMVSRDHYLQIELWRHQQNVDSNEMLDIFYESKIWSEYQNINGRPFLSHPHNLCLALNIDWFNPYDQTPSQLVPST